MAEKDLEGDSFEGPAYPQPHQHDEQIVLGHGSGGRMSHDLIAGTFLPPFDNEALRAGNDAGMVPAADGDREPTDCGYGDRGLAARIC